MTEADVLDPELILSSFPLGDPGEMHLIELPAKFMKFGLTKSGNFDLVGARKNNPEHGDPLHGQISRDALQLATNKSFSKAAQCGLMVRFQHSLPVSAATFANVTITGPRANTVSSGV